MSSPVSNAVTRGVRVDVRSGYVPERSKPESGYYFFAYRVQITNEGEVDVKLLSRHWRIIDGEGNQEDVRGPGVVGEQPFLAPGDTFTYTSACPLRTPTGTMSGTFQMLAVDGTLFDAEVGVFSLVCAEPSS